MLLHLRVLIELRQHAGSYLLSAIKLLDLVQDQRARHPLLWHRLDVFPMLRIIFDVFVNSGVDLRVFFERLSFRAGLAGL